MKEHYSYNVTDNKNADQYGSQPTYNWCKSYGVYTLIGISLFLSLFGEGIFRIIFAILDVV